MIKIRDHGDGGKWFVVAVHYPTALMAKRAWERAQSKLMPGENEDVGMYRLGAKQGNPNALDSGAPADVYPVVVVTLEESAAVKSARLLRDGTGWEPVSDFCDALILRRARVMHDMADQGTGRLVIRRPENRGAGLDAKGNMREPEGGQG